MAENYITKQVEKGSVNISEDVISVMVAAAAAEVEGVAGLGGSTTPELAELFGRKPGNKGVKCQFIDGKVTIDVLINVSYGGSITEIASGVQDAVCREVESITGMDCVVNVHVTGISFDK